MASSSNQQFTDPWQELIDQLVFQVYYRLLGMAPVLTDYQTTLGAVEWVASNIRGGTVSEVVKGRVAQWDGLEVTPGISGSPTMSLWVSGLYEGKVAPLGGSKAAQKRTLLVRKGWWTLYLPNRLGIASRVQTFRAPVGLLSRRKAAPELEQQQATS